MNRCHTPLCLALLAACVLTAKPVLAPPPGYVLGYHWADRAFAYADTYWDGTNPDYGDRLSSDCANFCSQIAQAGCSGLGEWNNTFFTDSNGTPWVGPVLDCWSYYNSEPGWSSAHDCQPSWFDQTSDYTLMGNHRVLVSAERQSWWFYCSDFDWWLEDVDVVDEEDIPPWVGPGIFAFHARNVGTPQNPAYSWHAVYVGSGSGNNARYWAHSTDRSSFPLTALRDWGNEPKWTEVYGGTAWGASSAEEGR